MVVVVVVSAVAAAAVVKLYTLVFVDYIKFIK